MPSLIRRLLPTLTLLALAAPLRADDKPKGEANATWKRIEKKTYEFKDAGKEMEYGLFLPSTYDKAKKTPLTRKVTERIFGECVRRGLLSMSYSASCRIQPPLTTDAPVGPFGTCRTPV